MTFVRVPHQRLLADAINIMPGTRAIPVAALRTDIADWERMLRDPTQSTGNRRLGEFFEVRAPETAHLGLLAVRLSERVQANPTDTEAAGLVSATAKRVVSRLACSRFIRALLIAPEGSPSPGQRVNVSTLARFLIDHETTPEVTAAQRVIVAKRDMQRLGFDDYNDATSESPRWYFSEEGGIYVVATTPVVPSEKVINAVAARYGGREAALGFIAPPDSVELQPFMSFTQLQQASAGS